MTRMPAITTFDRREPRMGLTPLALPPPGRGFDLRAISPRDFADFVHELYLSGCLSWDEYRMVGFPSELDPRWDSTIGALTGERAEPDRPRDMLAEWERRVDFMRRYQAADNATLRAQMILGALSPYASQLAAAE